MLTLHSITCPLQIGCSVPRNLHGTPANQTDAVLFCFLICVIFQASRNGSLLWLTVKDITKEQPVIPKQHLIPKNNKPAV